MRKYLALVKIGFKNALVYRADFFIWGFNEFLSTLIFLFIWTVIFGEKNAIAGFTLAETITYLIGAGLVDNIVSSWVSHDIQRDVQSGWLSNLLTKPLSYPRARIFFTISGKPINLVVRIAAYLLLALFFRSKLVITPDIFLIFLTLVSVFFAFLINYFFDFLVGSISFWITTTRGINNLVSTINAIFAGNYAPIAFFPKWFQTTASFLPFFYTVYFPLLIYLRKVSIMEAVKGIGIQIIWVIALYFLARFVWHKGVKKYEGVGI